jgi:cupin fold WbuC family metalloprotein
MMLEKISDEVYYLKGKHRVIDANLLDFLREKAERNPRRRCRICLHDAPDALIHEMFIAHGRDVFVPPHAHLNRGESFTVLSGLATLFLLDGQGRPTEQIPMGEQGSGRAVCVFVPANQWHTQVFESDMVIFHEVTSGPFEPSQNVTLWDTAGSEHEQRLQALRDELAAYAKTGGEG